GADLIFHASVNELETFKSLDNKPAHIWFRPTAPVYRDKLHARPQAELLYIGANQQGSRDAISHFLQDIWPHVLKRNPDTVLNIVGPVGANLDSGLLTKTVRIHGRVEDLTAFAGPDMIGLLPTRLMSGISIKVGEFLGMGLPIAAYGAGIDGYGDVLEGIVETADSADSFVDLVITLLNDSALRRKRSEAGLIAAETVLQNPEVISALSGLDAGTHTGRGKQIS
ncbi:MAG: glycosyltransferase, partial [Pseudomonadota bacterium]